MTEIQRYDLEVAIEKAYQDFIALPEPDRIAPNVIMLSRKYAPKNTTHLSECMADNKIIYWVDAKAGQYVFDVLISSVAETMGIAIITRYQQEQQKSAMEQAKNQAMRDTLMGLK